MFDFQTLKDKLFQGDVASVENLVRQAVSEKVAVEDILNKGLIAGMDFVGQKFKCNDIFVPEVLLSAKAMQAGLKILEPSLAMAGVKPVAKVAIGTVKGDLHDIGKNLVAIMLKGAGLDVLDFGIDVAPEKFVNAVKNDGVHIVAMSALLTTSMPSMKKTIETLRAAGVLDKVKTMIGGAPVTQEYADEIKADGYAQDAASAVDKAKELLGIKT
jgi:5-methyltetrahydrofolate--homocysteine methyltransferase